MISKEISTLKCPNLNTTRADGNSTRQIDFTIAKLFEGYTVIIEDHYNLVTKINPTVSKILAMTIVDRVTRRLREEHKLHRTDYIVTIKDRITIKLKE